MNADVQFSPEGRPTFLHVDLDALAHNFHAIREHVAPAKVMPVLKANAYGHGLVECAQHLEEQGAPSLAVAFVEEGIELRRAGIGVPILVFGGIFGSQIPMFLKHDLDLTASSVSKLEAIDAAAASMGTRARVHLKIDTGMERIGIHYYHAEQLLEAAGRARHCDVVGVFSHFATADEDGSDFTATQLRRFLECVRYYDARGVEPPLRHIANSAAVLGFEQSHLDYVRPGLALYGVSPAPHLAAVLPLRPVMSLRSTVVYFKVVPRGAGVSYGHRWKATEDTRVVTIPVGYGDGYLRRLSNKGSVLIRGRRYPIVGNVCMDQLMVSIGNGEAYNGDEVVLIGEQGGERITVGEISDLAETVPHEVLVSTNLRIPRRYERDGRLLP